MIASFRERARKFKSALQFRLLPRVVDYLTELATWEASRKLKGANVERVLVDNTVIAHGVTHETAWVDTGKALWGDAEIGTGYAARIPVHDDRDNTEVARSIRYLPGIASLARRRHLRLATSSELRDERLTQPVGRFRGYGLYDLSLFSDIAFESIEDASYTVVIGTLEGLPSVREQRMKRLKATRDPLFQKLVEVLGPANSQDAWHIATAEQNQCYCFLTMDFRLIRNVRAQANNATIKSLRTRVMTPEELGREFRIKPIPPRLYSYHGASFPVIHEENWSNSKRQGRRGVRSNET
jgi:hypothetical protein